MSLLLESWCWTPDWEIWLYKYRKKSDMVDMSPLKGRKCLREKQWPREDCHVTFPSKLC